MLLTLFAYANSASLSALDGWMYATTRAVRFSLRTAAPGRKAGRASHNPAGEAQHHPGGGEAVLEGGRRNHFLTGECTQVSSKRHLPFLAGSDLLKKSASLRTVGYLGDLVPRVFRCHSVPYATPHCWEIL